MNVPDMSSGLELAHELERLSRASVTVLGDVSLERVVHGTCAETGAGPLLLGAENAVPGAGAAIAHALTSLGVATALICVLGDDLPGAELTALIGAQPNVEPWLLVDGAKATTTSTRYVDGERLVLQTLRRDRRPMQLHLRERMLRIAGDAMTATSVTVLSDRGHGVLDPETIGQLLAGARQAGRRVVADLGDDIGPVDRFRGCDALIRVGLANDPSEEAETLRRSAELPSVVLMVPDGVVIADRDGVVGVSRPAWEDMAADYARVVAVYAAAIAVGRSPRLACRIACGVIPLGAPS